MAESSTQGHGLKGITLPAEVTGAGMRVGIVHTQWNREIIDALVGGARSELVKRGVAESDIVLLSVRVLCSYDAHIAGS